MENPSVVSIDLGSAYTKIANRDSWNSAGQLAYGLRAALKGEEDFCIPSVVARVDRERGTRWLIGADAANQMPSNKVQIFKNWKRALFAGREGDVVHQQAIEVAVAFFTEIRHALGTRLSDGRNAPVRVAVPRLAGAIDPAPVVKEILIRAGWDTTNSRMTVFEPESNAIGLLSRGRNQTWVPKQQNFAPPPKRMIFMQRMLEPGLSTAFRQMKREYTILVTDIGAFTTDFGLVRVDTSMKDDDWNRPEVVQQSVELGIQELDASILSVLEPSTQQYFEGMPAMEWELRKQQLYSGRPIRIVVDSKTLDVGDYVEGEAIKDQIRQFAKRVVSARQTFLRQHGISHVHEEAVTGGGSAVSLLRETLIDSIKTAKRSVHDLWDPNEPDIAIAAGAGRMTASEKDNRRWENRSLVRGGSAIGGASVFFE